MRLVALALVLCFASAHDAGAQLVVNDAAVTLRNAVTAIVKEYTLDTQRQQFAQIQKMSQRLSAVTRLAKYRLADVPRWRTHDFEHEDVFLYASPYTAALNYGDQSGAAFLAVSHELEGGAPEILARLAVDARQALRARLATIELAGATAIAGTHDTGRLRFNGRRELQAIEALQGDAANDSSEGSTTAVLSTISGAQLVAARQGQARLQLMSDVLEQLLVETKRDRDVEATALGMQLRTWRDAGSVNRGFAEGTGEALRTWRQP